MAEVVRGLKGFWVILSEYLTPPGQGVLVQLSRLDVTSNFPQG